MPTHRITLLRPGGEEQHCHCDEDSFILDAAEAVDIELPWGCRAGTCGSCAARLVSGEVAMDGQGALDDAQLGERFVLLCSARPLSDSVVRTDAFDEL
jgi:ferredoxin